MLYRFFTQERDLRILPLTDQALAYANRKRWVYRNNNEGVHIKQYKRLRKSILENVLK